ncbi:MAG: hypothetical protein A2Y62_08240, partial [Candidatus Fischerbacteria bacterium RBG_13_37_8]
MRDKLEYQKDGWYFAQCGRDLETLVAEELQDMQVQQVKTVRAGVHFQAEQEVFYRVNYCSRIASRILAPLVTFRCASENDLYKKGYNFEWEKILDTAHTFAIVSHVSNSAITHSQYAALKLKDAIADRFRAKYGKRPSVDRENPHILLHLNVQDNRAIISLDASGGPLYRRGYRMQGGEAPMQETLAAAIIRLSGWEGKLLLYDPMCGSGTLLAEALLHACHIPSCFRRQYFGFERLPDYDLTLWRKVKKNSDSLICEIPDDLIAGSDIEPSVLKMASANLSLITSGEKVKLIQCDFRQLPELKNYCIVCNLPYGVRQGEKEALKLLYKEFGDFLKR